MKFTLPRSRSLGFLVSLAIMLACNKESVAPTANDLSPFAKKFLAINSGQMNATALSRNSAINQSYTGIANTVNSMGGSVPGSDSTIVGEPWHTCATVTQYYNSDSSLTVIYDYGQGCNDGYGDFKNFVHGKTIQTTKYTTQVSGGVITSSYLYRSIFQNYGSRFYYNNDSTEWSQNGSSSYSGESSYDTAQQKFSGWYNYSDTTDYSYGSDSYSFRSLGKSTYDQTRSVTDKNDYRYTTGDNYYESEVTAPLVTDYSCNAYSQGGGVTGVMIPQVMWLTYVSGHEIVHYRQDGVEGMFEIDYGDGTCDNIITVIENGKVIRIDLGKDYPLLAASNH